MEARLSTPTLLDVRQESDCSICLSRDSLHDLASPVNQICSMTDLILRKYDRRLDEEGELLLGFVKTSAQRLQAFMDGLKTYIQVIGSPVLFRPCDINALLAAAVVPLQAVIEETGAIVTHELLPEVSCDPSQMSYVFTSMIDNSIKFRSERRPEIKISCRKDGKAWIFSIRDNGMGIDTRHSERIFRVFKRIHNDTFPGAGVGLAVAQTVIHRHHGKIWFESEVGEGTTFYLSLPETDQ